MKFQDLLNESLDKPFDWHWEKKTERYAEARFHTDGGQKGEVNFAIKLKSYMGDPNPDMAGIAEILFEIDFGFDISGKGEAFRIFATVKDIILDYIKYMKSNKLFKGISFTAKEASRKKLYDVLSKKVAQTTPYKNVSKKKVDDGQTRYTMRKK